VSYDIFTQLAAGGAFGPWSHPTQVPVVNVPAPKVLGSESMLGEAINTLWMCWVRSEELLSNIPYEKAKHKVRAIMKSTGDGELLQSFAEDWLAMDGSPSPVLWFVWARTSNRASSMKTSVQAFKQGWLRRLYFDEFGDRYQRARKVYPKSGVEWVGKYKKLLDISLRSPGDFDIILPSLVGLFGGFFEVALDLQAKALQETAKAQHQVDLAVAAMQPGLWMYDWKPPLRIKNTVANLGV